VTTANFPQAGDLAVDLRTNGRANGRPDQVGQTVTVKNVLTTIVITSDGERYNRSTLKPITEGRYSGRQLVPASDNRVLVVRARSQLSEVAATAGNLAELDHRKPEDVVTALARISRAAYEAHRAVIDLMADASRTEQESPR
jgi:hypothetical protein